MDSLFTLDPLPLWIAAALTATLLAHAALAKFSDLALFEQHLAAYRMPEALGPVAVRATRRLIHCGSRAGSAGKLTRRRGFAATGSPSVRPAAPAGRTRSFHPPRAASCGRRARSGFVFLKTGGEGGIRTLEAL